MTPRKLDWQAIEPRLAQMRRLLDQLGEIGELDEVRLRAQEVPALATERILTLVVDLAVSINSHVSVARLRESPPDYTESFNTAARAGLITDELSKVLAPSAGMRNALIHAYVDVDYAQVADSIPLTLRHYREYIRQAAGWLRDQAD